MLALLGVDAEDGSPVEIPLRFALAALDWCRGRLFFAYYYEDLIYVIETAHAIRGRHAAMLLRMFPMWTSFRVRELRIDSGCMLSLARQSEVVDIVLY